MSDAQKTCFVVMGYGVKVDYPNGRELDLDKTYENIIKPVCVQQGLRCFRGKDIAINGIIDKPMYEWILRADVVIADVSTLNPNALYELGVRHALRPFSTIVIAEERTQRPFDVDHTVIDPYEHLGKDIGVSEARRFKGELGKKLRMVLSESKTDSPVYTYLPNLVPPLHRKPGTKPPQKKAPDNYPSISTLIQDAERLKNAGDYILAKSILQAARAYDWNNTFIIQRLALVTYKSKKPNPIKALKLAKTILKPLNPDTTTDPETLGLSGAIEKRLFEETGRLSHLAASLAFYERGYYVKQDYYNGINVAFVCDLLAEKASSKQEAIFYLIRARKIREDVVKKCDVLLSTKNLASRSDAVWIAQTAYQCYFGNGAFSKARKYLSLVSKFSKGDFDRKTFEQHLEKLRLIQRKVRKRHGIRLV